MSPGHIVARFGEIFEHVWRHPSPEYRKEAVMTAFTHLGAYVEALVDENNDLKNQLAAAQAQPAGTSDADLDGLSAQIKTALGHDVPDPDDETPPGGSGNGSSGAGTSAATPVVGTDSTTVTGPTSGNVTTLVHATGQVTTTNSDGQQIEPDQGAGQSAATAAQAQGVSLPGLAPAQQS